MNNIIKLISQKSSLVENIMFGFFVALSIWWAVLFFVYGASLEGHNLIWAASYQVIAVFGALWGLIIGMRWGGFKSVMGRAIMFFALGLFFQIFGQSVFSFYGLFLDVEIPYPSLADIGFFGSIPLYIMAILELHKATGASFSLRSIGGKVWTALLPIFVLIGSYILFLEGYIFDWSTTTSTIRIILDFGYPLGEAVYVSIAILTYLFSRKLLGGAVKDSILLIIAALIMQYIAEFNFLYQFANDTWVNGGYGDFLYLAAYFMMGLGLIKIGTAFKKIKGS